jgi:benzodiazapine receptor
MDVSAFIALGIFLVLNFLTSLSGAIFKPGAWYESLARPGWTPPNWAFPVVWSVLYLMNAASGWLVWQAAGTAALPALGVYLVSLIVNASWSAVFFGLRRMDLGLFNVALLWMSIIAVATLLWPFSKTAAALQLPYLLWVSIAAALNFTVWRMNRGASASA